MRDLENIRELVKLEPDYIGFIFYEKSARYIGKKISKEILDVIPPSIKKVGVFVNATEREMKNAITENSLNVVQLHGNESPEMCQIIRMAGVEVIKAFPVDEEFDFHSIQRYRESCGFYLFDTKTPQYGGSGKQFDWTLLDKHNFTKPVFLSGGIGLEDAEKIIRLNNKDIKVIDINSRFEIEPGLKDIDKVKRFIEIIRGEKKS
jgi:phosphoribosylanthranilate isomerase